MIYNKVIYVAAPLNAPTAEEREANRRHAARWSGWLSATFKVCAVTQWVVLSSVWSEEEGRELGLEIDKALIERCDGVFLCPPRVSSGMAIESGHAKSVGVSVFTAVDSPVEPERMPRVCLEVLAGWIASLPERPRLQTVPVELAESAPGPEMRPCASCVAGGDETPQPCQFYEDTGMPEPSWLCEDCYRDWRAQP